MKNIHALTLKTLTPDKWVPDEDVKLPADLVPTTEEK